MSDMTNLFAQLKFAQPNLLRMLEECDDVALDALPFGVVGMNVDGTVDRYNAEECKIAGLSKTRVLFKNFFNEVAPCTNNFLVSQRFQDELTLDEIVPYVFTLRMRPRKVELRLLKGPASKHMYLLVRDQVSFTKPDLLSFLEEADDAVLDGLAFGVVGMLPDGTVTRYNTAEGKIAGLTPARVIGKNFFNEVAPCTNNYLVSQRLQDEPTLDETLPYVFTLKMRPRKVELRLLKSPTAKQMYLLVQER